MRMRFREFVLSEIAGMQTLGTNLYGADARHDIWNLPSINTRGIQAQHMPPGGFQNFSQISQYHQNIARFEDEDYIVAMTLEKLATLAENAVEGIRNKGSSVKPSAHYQLAGYNVGDGSPPSNPSVPPGWIIGLQESDIISGLYPRLKHEELARARQLHIIVEIPGRGFNFNVNLLRKMMQEYQHKLAGKEQSFYAVQHLAGTADNVMSKVFAPGSSSNSGVNPWAATV